MQSHFRNPGAPAPETGRTRAGSGASPRHGVQGGRGYAVAMTGGPDPSAESAGSRADGVEAPQKPGRFRKQPSIVSLLIAGVLTLWLLLLLTGHS